MGAEKERERKINENGRKSTNDTNEGMKGEKNEYCECV